MTKIHFKKVSGGKYKYELCRAYKHRLPECMEGASGEIDGKDASSPGARKTYVVLKDRRLDLFSGYQWNGADWFPDFPWTFRASLVHDALCQLIGEGLISDKYRRCADRELYCMVREDKSKRWASVMYFAIRGHVKTIPVLGGLLGGFFGLFAKVPSFLCGEAVTPDE